MLSGPDDRTFSQCTQTERSNKALRTHSLGKGLDQRSVYAKQWGRVHWVCTDPVRNNQPAVNGVRIANEATFLTRCTLAL
ncbi:hypothetical protein Rcae01_05464 [Novipirellula caenicola]|uniref:Uncharacterized protein n=1 Tax=Novipirellula caenicola TaxID=1536901 RepID=A0ABP9VXV0_9BACT